MSDSDDGNEVIRICSPHFLQQSNPAFSPFGTGRPVVKPTPVVHTDDFLQVHDNANVAESEGNNLTGSKMDPESFSNLTSWIQKQQSPGGFTAPSSNTTPQAPSPGSTGGGTRVSELPSPSPGGRAIGDQGVTIHATEVSSSPKPFVVSKPIVVEHPVLFHQSSPNPGLQGLQGIPYGSKSMGGELKGERSPQSQGSSANATPHSRGAKSTASAAKASTYYQPQQPVHIPVSSLSEPNTPSPGSCGKPKAGETSNKASPVIQLSGQLQAPEKPNHASNRQTRHQNPTLGLQPQPHVGTTTLTKPFHQPPNAVQHIPINVLQPQVVSFPQLQTPTGTPGGLNATAQPFQVGNMNRSPGRGMSQPVMFSPGGIPAGFTAVQQSPVLGLSSSLVNSPATQQPFSSPQPPQLITVEEYKGKIVETAKDQYGCRCLQRTLELPWESPEVQLIVDELKPVFADLMMNAYGNFLTQKVLEVAPSGPRLELVANIADKLPSVGITPHGTFAVQKLIESARSVEERKLICDGLNTNLSLLAMDANGGHVLHKILSCIAPEERHFVTEAICANMARIARDKNGCCIVQRCIERSATAPDTQLQLAKAICDYVHLLLPDPYGNYVVQCLIEKSAPSTVIIDLLVQAIGKTGPAGFQLLCVNQFSSKAVEKAFLRCSKARSAQLLDDCCLTSREDLLQVILLDNFGNYIVQTFLAQALTIFSIAATEKHQLAVWEGKRASELIAGPEPDRKSLDQASALPPKPIATISQETINSFAALLVVTAKAMPPTTQPNLPGFVRKIEVKLEQANRQYQLYQRGTPTPPPSFSRSGPPTPIVGRSPARGGHDTVTVGGIIPVVGTQPNGAVFVVHSPPSSATQ